MCDGSLDVRQNAKRIFSILKELPEFQVSGCQLGHFIFQIGLNFANLKCQKVEMCSISSVYLSFWQLQNLSPDDLVSSLARGRQRGCWFWGSEKRWSLISAYRSLAITTNTHGFKKLSTALNWLSCLPRASEETRYAVANLDQSTEMHFASFLSGGFTTIAVICLPDWKLANHTLVQSGKDWSPVFTLIDTHYSLFQSILRLAVPEHVSQKIRKQLDSLQSEDSKNR